MEQEWNKRNEMLFWKASKSLKGLERETGLEPATSSLGNYPSIDNREHMRQWR